MRKRALRGVVGVVTAVAASWGLVVSTAAPAGAAGLSGQGAHCNLVLTTSVQATNCEFAATGATGNVTWLAEDLHAAQGLVGYLNGGCTDPLAVVVATVPVTADGAGSLAGVRPGDCVLVSLVGDIIVPVGNSKDWATGVLLVSG